MPTDEMSIKTAIIDHFTHNLEQYSQEETILSWLDPEVRQRIVASYQRFIEDFEADPDIPLFLLQMKLIAVQNEVVALADGSTTSFPEEP